MQKLYQENENFKDYVDKYAKMVGAEIDDVLKLKIVKETAKMYMENEKNVETK